MELHYGCVGDMEHTAWNPIRDTVFGGWQEGYEVAGFGGDMAFGASLINDVLTVRNSERMVAGDIGERAQSVQ